MYKIRKAVFAGTWYEDRAGRLESKIRGWVEEAKKDFVVKSGRVRALVVPHAGYEWSGDVAGGGYALVCGLKFKRVFVLCPNHRVSVHGVVVGPYDAFETPLGQVIVDRDLLLKWLGEGFVVESELAHRNEHAIEVQLPFIQVVLGRDVKVVPLIVGAMQDDEILRFSQVLKGELGEDDLLVISSDFSHYGAAYDFEPFMGHQDVAKCIEAYDMCTFEALKSLHPGSFNELVVQQGPVACGVFALKVLIGVFEGSGAEVDLVRYIRSGEKSGDYSMSVSYMSIVVCL